MINSPMAHLVSTFVLDGKEYEIEQFKIEFIQPTDFKNEPSTEIRGGQIMLNLAQIADNNLYLWAKTSTMLKNGSVLFQTDLGMTVMRIDFTKGYCISLRREINSFKGTSTTLVISPEIVMVNGVGHDNFWPEK